MYASAAKLIHTVFSMETRDLRAILTPDLLISIYNTALPAPGTTVERLFEIYFGDGFGGDTIAKLHALALHKVFVPLSHILPASYPSNLLSPLPNPASKDFPKQALGLLLLLDQVTRLILKRHNVRWTAGFFDPLALRLAQQLDELPPALHLTNVQRWMGIDAKLSWSDAMLRCSLFTLPFTHSEKPAVQARAQDLAEQQREAVESYHGRRDPSRDDGRARVDDAVALPRLVQGVVPPVYFAGGGFGDFFFFDCQITRAHASPLEEFGRYPWRNAMLGRIDTGKEAEFLLSIGNFARMEDEIRRDIRGDVVRSVWRPLETPCSEATVVESRLDRDVGFDGR